MAKKKPKFEDQLGRIREIAEEMQKAETDFDKNVELFKEGSKLIKEARKFLDESELEVQKLVENAEDHEDTED